MIYRQLRDIEKSHPIAPKGEVRRRRRTRVASCGASKAPPHEGGIRLSRSKPKFEYACPLSPMHSCLTLLNAFISCLLSNLEHAATEKYNDEKIYI